MIFEYKQKDTQPNIQQIIYKNTLIGTGSSRRHFSGNLTLNDNYYEVIADSEGKIILKENEIVIGEIRQELKRFNIRKVFDKTISYYELDVKGRLFEIFHITFWQKDNNFYQIEEHGRTVGMIQKSDKVVNYNHQYKCYVESNDMVLILALWCLFLQSSKYYPFMISGEGTISKRRVSCSAKHVKEKYDASFIPKIKA